LELQQRIIACEVVVWFHYWTLSNIFLLTILSSIFYFCKIDPKLNF
jgi:hypothetical protein